jgi:ABC-2 type transport system permease protein
VSGPASAIGYLWVRTTTNRVRSQLKRIRSPRYAIATVLGLAYMYFAIVRRGSSGAESGGPFGTLLDSEFIIPIASVLLLLNSARWWLFGSDRSALAFTPAEVQFLFPAPISRRGLVHAKLLRGQILILFNTLLWTVLLRGGASSFGGWKRGLAMWLLFSTLALHRLGVAIVRSNAIEHERAGRRRSLIPVIIFLAIIAAVAWGVLSQWNAIAAASIQGVKAAAHVVVLALSQTLPNVALWPARSLVAPVFAPSTSVWLRALPFSALVFVLNYIWVLRLDASFEEAALEATQVRAERIQNLRSAQGTRKRAKSGKLTRIPKLSLTGRPEIAIAWKNVAAAIRSSSWRISAIVFFVGLCALAIISRLNSEEAADIFIALSAFWGGMLVFLGPISLRFDLRLDLPRLAILKTYPVSGARLVAAEIAGVTLLHSITIWTIMIVPITLYIIDPGMFESVRAMPIVLLSIALGVPAMNLLMFTVHNGAALMFPSWVRLSSETRGFETMGQNLLTIGATLLIAAVALVFPIGMAALIFWAGSSVLGSWALLLGTVAASALLCLELWPVIFWLGSVFDRMDVSEVAGAQ